MGEGEKGETLKKVVIGTSACTWLCLIIVMIVQLNVYLGDLGLDVDEDGAAKFRGHQITDPLLYTVVLVLTIVGALKRNAPLMYVSGFVTVVLFCLQASRIHFELNNQDIDLDNDFAYGVGFLCEAIIDVNELNENVYSDEARGCRATATFRFFALFGMLFNIPADVVLGMWFN